MLRLLLTLALVTPTSAVCWRGRVWTPTGRRRIPVTRTGDTGARAGNGGRSSLCFARRMSGIVTSNSRERTDTPGSAGWKGRWWANTGTADRVDPPLDLMRPSTLQNAVVNGERILVGGAYTADQRPGSRYGWLLRPGLGLGLHPIRVAIHQVVPPGSLTPPRLSSSSFLTGSCIEVAPASNAAR